MNKGLLTRVALVALAAHLLFLAYAKMPADAPGAELFTNGPLAHISVQLDKAALESLRRDHRQPVHATVKEGQRTYQNVAVHIKGAAGSLRDIDDRPALTLIFNKYVTSQKFHGLSRIHLNNSVQDPAYLDEQICGEICRAAGVPAARAAAVSVTLNERKLGIYVMKEGFSKEFLKQYFNGTDGNLYDGGFVSDISDGTHRSAGHGPSDHSDLKKLMEASQEPDPAKRWQRLNSLLEVDRFISLMAVETLILHWDGYSQKANNYRVYFNPDDNKFVFFAHGMDQMFGRGGNYQTSIFPEMGGSVAQAIISLPQGRDQYTERLRQIVRTSFQATSLTNRVQILAAPIRAELAGQQGELRDFDWNVKALQQRIADRCADVEKQIKALPHGK